MSPSVKVLVEMLVIGLVIALMMLLLWWFTSPSPIEETLPEPTPEEVTVDVPQQPEETTTVEETTPLPDTGGKSCGQ